MDKGFRPALRRSIRGSSLPPVLFGLGRDEQGDLQAEELLPASHGRHLSGVDPSAAPVAASPDSVASAAPDGSTASAGSAFSAPCLLTHAWAFRFTLRCLLPAGGNTSFGGVNMHVVKRRNPVDQTTWEFLRPGWWAFHAVAIGGMYLLGRRLGRQ